MIHYILQFGIPFIVSIFTTWFSFTIGKRTGYDEGFDKGVRFCAKLNIYLIKAEEEKRQEILKQLNDLYKATKGSSLGEEKCTSK